MEYGLNPRPSLTLAKVYASKFMTFSISLKRANDQPYLSRSGWLIEESEPIGE
jgi:hypothetical protein